MNVSRHTITIIALVAVACIGAGCTREGATLASQEAAAKRVLTVDEYLKQPELRKKVFASCANDPGRKGDDPNCVNALRAERIASAGTGRFPSVTP
jgi:hypothetical protein